jgi:hypothetical protein
MGLRLTENLLATDNDHIVMRELRLMVQVQVFDTI